MEKDRKLSFTPLTQAEPGISLGELERYVSNAPAKSSIPRYALLSFGALLIASAAVVMVLQRSNDLPPRQLHSFASESVQAQANFSTQPVQQRSRGITPRAINTPHKVLSPFAGNKNWTNKPGIAPAETAGKLVPEAFFTQPAMLCINVTVQQDRPCLNQPLNQYEQ